MSARDYPLPADFPKRPPNLLDASGCLCAAGDCEGCNALVEAWEAMREALSDGCDQLDVYASAQMRAALNLADKVMTRGR